MVSLQKGSYALSWSLTAQKAKGSVLTSEKLTAQTATILNTETTTKDSFEAPGISSGLRYSNLFASAPEISVVYSVFHNKVEEDIYINAPTDIRSFSMNVTAPGLVAVVKKDGSVEFVDKEGELQYRVGIPYMLDAKDEVLNDIEVTVEQGKSSFIITYTPNEEWLTAAERAYPILLDPSITTKEYNSNITDTYVKNGDTANHSAEISIYYGIKSGVLHRGYIKINNLPEINPEMPITEATATFTLKTGTNTGKTAEIHRVNQAWNASTITFANAPTSTTLLSSCPFNNSTMTFDLTANMRDMIEFGADNYGYMIKYADESTTNPDYNGYYSTEYTTASKRPVITIKYYDCHPDEISVGGVYSFQNVGSGAFMTVDSGMDADATNVYQYNTQVPPLTSKEKFKLEYVSSTGGYLLRAMCSESGTNRVLDIAREGGFVESGCNVQIYRNTDALAQHWFIIPWRNDEYILIPRTNMSLALSAYPSAANGTADGTTATSPGNIYVSAFTGSAYQKWKIIPDGAYDEPYVEITGVANVNEGDCIDLGCSSVPFGLAPEWDTSNPSVATVSPTGRVQGLRAGYTDITVSCTVPSTGEVLQATERIYVTIPNGSYFIKNRETGKYVQPDNDDGPNYTNRGGILEQLSLDIGKHQWWNFTYVGSGYYKITCVKNGYAITVPAGQETASGPNLILGENANWDNQKWLITGTDGGYRISAKCAGPELVMAVQVSDLSTIGEHLNIQQKSYVYNESYKDEWVLQPSDCLLPTPLIAQDENMWCWVACAQMLARTKYPTSANTGNNHTIKWEQRDAVYDIFGDSTSTSRTYHWATDPQGLKEKGGYYYHVADAAAYLVGMANGDETFSAYLAPYTEENLLRFLLDGHAVARLSGWIKYGWTPPSIYEEQVAVFMGLEPDKGGHVTVIVGAEWSPEQQCYMYIVHDPWGEGTRQRYTYMQLLFTLINQDGQSGFSLWFPTVVTKTEYSDNTFLGEENGIDYSAG